MAEAFPGQRGAVLALARAACRNSLPGREAGDGWPISIVGPRGSGHERLAAALADAMDRPFHRINLGEYTEKSSSSRLFGAPPGYVGHESGGLFYDVAKRAPSGVLLFANAGNAHPSVVEMVRECLEAGSVNDSTARVASLAGIQVVFTADIDDARSPIGFGSAQNEAVPTGIPALDGADTLIRISAPLAADRLSLVRQRVECLGRKAAASGIRMTMAEGAVELLSGLVKSFSDNSPGSFKSLVELPVLDYIVTNAKDFVVAVESNVVRIIEDAHR